MNAMNIYDLQVGMLIGMFFLGGLAFILGVAILVTGVWRRDIRTITSQTARIAQKGLAEEISGLVGNASTLLNTLNDMVRTSTGIGVFLSIFGGLIMGIACWFILNIQ